MKKRIIFIILIFLFCNFLLSYVSTPLFLYSLRTILYITIGLILFCKVDSPNPHDFVFFLFIGLFMIILILLPVFPVFPKVTSYILVNHIQNLAGIILGICLSNLIFKK